MSRTRTSSEPLSTAEINSLRRVGTGQPIFLSRDHRLLLTAMGFVAVDASGRLTLTHEGMQRLSEDDGREPASDVD